MLHIRSSSAIMTFMLAAGRSSGFSLVLNPFPASIVRNSPRHILDLVSQSVPPPLRSTSQHHQLVQPWASSALHTTSSHHASSCAYQRTLCAARDSSTFEITPGISRSVRFGSQFTALAAARSSAGHNNVNSSSSSSTNSKSAGVGKVRRVVSDTAKIPLTGPRRTGATGRRPLGASNAWDGRAAANGVDQREFRRVQGVGASRGVHDQSTPREQFSGEIPEDQLQMSFSRSSGSGGQNVNKLSTKVELRFVVADAEWLPHDVRLRMARHQRARINNRGELVITAQEFRTQKQNRTQALHKLREMINEAWEPAKERKMRTGISKAGKEIRKADKRHRSQVKAGRSKLSSRDFD